MPSNGPRSKDFAPRYYAGETSTPEWQCPETGCKHRLPSQWRPQPCSEHPWHEMERVREE